MTSIIANVAEKMYLCIRNRHITLLKQMDTAKAHKTSCRTWRLVFMLLLECYSESYPMKFV